MTREEQKEQRRKQILHAALDLFITKGYTATQVADIAAAANMSAGLLFHYFDSKECLYAALVQIGLQGTKVPMQMDFTKPIEFFSVFSDSLFRYAREQPMTAKLFVLMGQLQRCADVPASVRELARQLDTVEQCVAIIRAGQKDGTIRTGDPLALSNAFWCSIQGIMEQYAHNTAMPLPEADWIVDILRNKERKGND